MGFDYRTYIRLEKQSLGGHKQNIVHTRIQEKAAETPQEIDPELPRSVWEPLVDTWVGGGLLQGQGLSVAVCTGPLKGGLHYVHYLHHSLVSGQTTTREHSPAHQQKVNSRFAKHGSANQNKTQFPLQ